MEANAKLAVVILAAGKGTRLKSRRPKVLHEIGGKPLLAHVIAAAGKVVAPAGIYVVVGHQAERVKAEWPPPASSSSSKPNNSHRPRNPVRAPGRRRLREHSGAFGRRAAHPA